MGSILTLITNPHERKLTDSDRLEAFTRAEANTFHVTGHEWLSRGEALDIWLDGAADKQEWVSKLAADMKIDAILQPDNNQRRKKLLICDMDSTIITIECIDEIADEVGMKDHVAAITERAMNGELDFAQALEERVALLKGLKEGVLNRVYDKKVRFMDGANELVGTMRAQGAYCMLVSGGFTYFTNRVKRSLNFHEQRANVLEVVDGELTGRVVPPILGKEAKLAALKETCTKKGIRPELVMAVGDGANDLPMLMAAGMGIAFHAKPVVQQQAKAALNHSGLRGALFAQGYHAQEIITVSNAEAEGG